MSISIKQTLHFIGSPEEFLADIAVQNTMLLIDENVLNLHGKRFEGFDSITIPSGESQKRMEVVEYIIAALLDAGIDRNGTLIGIGGGVVTDLTGFVASVYLRGINFGFLPTTLLAMCDASIGGKNGINFGAFKNMVGTITQPNFIAFYPAFLSTLSDREFNSGMAEVIKHAVINGGALQKFLQENKRATLLENPEKLKELCQLAAEVKVTVVEEDEKENGLRKKLNLGHTIGHAIEALNDLTAPVGFLQARAQSITNPSVNSKKTHGECVAIGMVLAARIAVRKGLAKEEFVEEVIAYCNAYGLPIKTEIKPELLMEKILKDKKRKSAEIDFIMPYSFGDVRIVSLALAELENHLKEMANE
jgi:3-dehydroquinate synthase